MMHRALATRLWRGARSASAWSGLNAAPADPILGLTVEYNNDPAPNKVSLGVGAYRDGDGKSYVLPSVRAAEARIVASMADHEYAPISGDAGFLEAALDFAYGAESAPLAEKRVAAVQTLSGTGACRLVGELMAKLPSIGGSGAKPIAYLPEPTWGNHVGIMKDAGLEVRRYRYLDAKTKTTLDFDGMLEDVAAMEPGSLVLLHLCAHNPTGVDPSLEQWAAISRACAASKVQVFFDSAYQGFASGCAERDALPFRAFVQDGHQLLLAQSFAKNFGLYGERVGALSAVCGSAAEKTALESQLKAIARAAYSSPPVFGARVVKTILQDAQLREQWTGECAAMAARIMDMRHALKTKLEERGSTRDWSHITAQIGMFAYTGLSSDQVLAMRARFHVYCTQDGRISVAGLTPSNLDHVADAIHAVTSD